MFVPKSLDDLRRIVKERLEETIQLEFKRELPPSGKNDDLAKDVAAMANAQGGVIVYGIDEDDTGRAKGLQPFPIAGVAERVTLVAQTLDQALTLSNVDTILAHDSKDNGFLVVEIETSGRAPHFLKGMALGRTAKGNVPLTRRQVGELFARSPGFAQEFGLTLARPGRVKATHVPEAYQESDQNGRLRTHHRYYLVFENDGEAEVHDAGWEWVTSEGEERLPAVFENQFPVSVLAPGARIRIQLAHTLGTARDLQVRTRWMDKQGRENQQVWPLSW